MRAGVAFAMAAGLMWGLMFLAPLLLPGYPAALLSVGRYLAFGLVALPLAWLDRRALARLARRDWLVALRLVAIGNLLYYLCLASAIQRAGGPLPIMLNSTLPVVIAISARLRGGSREGHLPWARLWPSLLLIGTGIACVGWAELAAAGGTAPAARYASGALLAIGAVACWTWYPLRNADWLKQNPGCPPRTWSIAQGLAMLPLALTAYLALWIWLRASGDALPMPLGSRPLAFLGLAATLGFFSTWLGSVCWNQASRRLPTSLAGQLMVFETLAGLAYVYLWLGRWPAPTTLLGIGLLLAGVLWAVRTRPV